MNTSQPYYFLREPSPNDFSIANRMNELLKVKVNNFLEEEPEGW